MNYKTLRTIAEKVENALLEKQAIGEITSYDIEFIPDDMKIQAWYFKNPGIKKIKVNLSVCSDLRRTRTRS